MWAHFVRGLIISARLARVHSQHCLSFLSPANFFLNEEGDLSFLSRYLNLAIALFVLKHFQKNELLPEIRLAHHSRA